jgi:hypothetical protein
MSNFWRRLRPEVRPLWFFQSYRQPGIAPACWIRTYPPAPLILAVMGFPNCVRPAPGSVSPLSLERR